METQRTRADEANAGLLSFELGEALNELKGRSVLGAGVTLISQIARVILHVVSIAILARLLVPADFGLVAMVTAITAFSSMLRDMGLGTAIVQRSSVTAEQLNTLFWINAGASLLLAALIAAASPAIAALYGDSRIVPIALAIAPSIFLMGLSVQHRALLMRQLRFTGVAVVDLTALAIAVAMAMVVAAQGAGYWALVLLPIVQAVLSTTGVWFICPWRPRMSVNVRSVGSMAAFGGNVTGFNLLNYLSRNFDDVLIGWRWGAGPLGLYAKAYDLLLLPLRMINAPISTVAVPLLSRLQSSPDRYRNAYLAMVGKIGFVTMPIIAYMIVSGDWLIVAVLGERWVSAVDVFRWLAIAALVQVPCNTTGWLFMSQDRTKEMLAWSAFASVTAVVSFIVGLPWGINGVATSYAVVTVMIHAPVLLWFVGRTGPISTTHIYGSFWAPLALSIWVVAVLTAFRNVTELNPVPGSLISLAIGAAAVGVAVYSLPMAKAAAIRDWRFLRSAWGTARG